MPAPEWLRSIAHQQTEKYLLSIFTNPTAANSEGYPIIAGESFALFIQKVPHLFQQGQAVLDWLDTAEKHIQLHGSKTPAETLQSWHRAIQVIRTVVLTAAVTAPTDLWLLNQVLSSHHRLGLLDIWRAGRPVQLYEFATSHGLDSQILGWDFSFLFSRGLLTVTALGAHKPANLPQVMKLLQTFEPRPDQEPADLVPALQDYLATGKGVDREPLINFFKFPSSLKAAPSWQPGLLEIMVGSRLVPLILALKLGGHLKDQKRGSQFTLDSAPVKSLLFHAGCLSAEGFVTALGERAMERGSGPFGIIHAYHGYMDQHMALLQKKTPSAWVARGANVAASQDANRKTFKMANDSLDQFCSKYQVPIRLFIEHAVGKGEATRQRYERDRSKDIHYFGADLEDAAIDAALAEQKKGVLPATMSFVRKADIGKADILLQAIRSQGLDTTGGVMIVGNGFHEIRQTTDQGMVEIFKAYSRAGLILIFTEESALEDEDLIATAWNTYHAGFRYVHELSGQGLRPVYDREDGTGRYSWHRCAELGGYHVSPEFTRRTRTIYPHPRRDGKNPAISVTYFCVPHEMATQLGMPTS